jgi:L-threonylcarbamoyladenylate synthase
MHPVMAAPETPQHRPPFLPPTNENIEAAARALIDGRLVAFPTETVYGLGADATNDGAVAAVFAAKHRPRFNPLIIHVVNHAAACGIASFDERANRLAEVFWPGPMTLVLPRRPDCAVSLLASAGLDTIAVRVPRHPSAQALLRACRRPIAAPSANPSGKISPTTAAHVQESLGGHVAMILDGGPCAIGIESTVVDLCGSIATILRPGGVTEEAIAEAIGRGAIRTLASDDSTAPRSPGQLATHYAPDLPLRTNAKDVSAREALLAFGPDLPAGAAITLNLSPSADLSEAAANLFAMLRALDRPGLEGIAVMPIPDEGLGQAINDRLRRAANQR